MYPLKFSDNPFFSQKRPRNANSTLKYKSTTKSIQQWSRKSSFSTHSSNPKMSRLHSWNKPSRKETRLLLNFRLSASKLEIRRPKKCYSWRRLGLIKKMRIFKLKYKFWRCISPRRRLSWRESAMKMLICRNKTKTIRSWQKSIRIRITNCLVCSKISATGPRFWRRKLKL